jgi:hypothetical protein
MEVEYLKLEPKKTEKEPLVVREASEDENRKPRKRIQYRKLKSRSAIFGALVLFVIIALLLPAMCIHACMPSDKPMDDEPDQSVDNPKKDLPTPLPFDPSKPAFGRSGYRSQSYHV